MLWGNKPYNSLKYFLKNKFGQKVYKISIDAGFTCPNRDGTISSAGCIFCSERGSGDFTGDKRLSIQEQLLSSNKGIIDLSTKHNINKYIAYFQAYTNTYDQPEILRQKYTEAISNPSVVGIAVATRPDCLSNDVLKVLDEINKITYLWVELGLQTCHDDTAKIINRGYDLKVFDEALINLHSLDIDIVSHVIFGLPGEDRLKMLETIKYLASTKITGIKIHSLHVLQNTFLAQMYKNNEFTLLTLDQYVSLVVDGLELLPENIVIHRLTGDGPKDLLIGPEWSKNKIIVLNAIEEKFKKRNSWQGKLK